MNSARLVDFLHAHLDTIIWVKLHHRHTFSKTRKEQRDLLVCLWNQKNFYLIFPILPTAFILICCHIFKVTHSLKATNQRCKDQPMKGLMFYKRKCMTFAQFWSTSFRIMTKTFAVEKCLNRKRGKISRETSFSALRHSGSNGWRG